MAERGTRLPESWIPTDKDIAYAESLGMSQDQIQLEAEKFRNYWLSLTGQRATKLDWHRTWRNWVLKDYAKGDAFRAWQNANPPAVYNGQSLETIAEIARKPWGRCRYPRDVLEQCVAARKLTKDEMEAAL